MELAMAKQQRVMAISQQAASMKAQATQYTYPRFLSTFCVSVCLRRSSQFPESARAHSGAGWSKVVQISAMLGEKASWTCAAAALQ